MYTESEILMHEDTLRALRAGLGIAELIKETLDCGQFPYWHDAIDAVIKPDFPNSLMGYLIWCEKYEACAFIKDEFEKIIIDPLRLGWVL